MPMPDPNHPSHREAIAAFRLGIVGDLLVRELARGELTAELKARAQQRYRPPGSATTRTYHWKTLQSWLLAARKGSSRLQPQSRARGFALALDDEQQQTLLNVRRAHPTASAELILSEAVRHGVVAANAVSVSTLRRLFRAHDLSRDSLNRAGRRAARRRWSARRAGDLWHADVCHVAVTTFEGRRRTWRVHALVDDRSRYIIALEVHSTEAERDLLEVFCLGLLRHPAPGVFFVDNGSCYRGDVLVSVTQKLDIRLVHARPYDPEARGLMERLWRTMRQQCTDHLGPIETAAELSSALWAWMDAYHRRPHGGLMGRRPRDVYLEEPRGTPILTAKVLSRALEITVRRRVRKDATLSVDGALFETEGWLAGKTLELRRCGLIGEVLGARYDQRDVPIGPCDPVVNATRARPTPADAADAKPPEDLPFHPVQGWLAAAREDDDDV